MICDPNTTKMSQAYMERENKILNKPLKHVIGQADFLAFDNRDNMPFKGAICVINV